MGEKELRFILIAVIVSLSMSAIFVSWAASAAKVEIARQIEQRLAGLDNTLTAALLEQTRLMESMRAYLPKRTNWR